jgi:hypothetical protein
MNNRALTARLDAASAIDGLRFRLLDNHRPLKKRVSEAVYIIHASVVSLIGFFHVSHVHYEHTDKI